VQAIVLLLVLSAYGPPPAYAWVEQAPPPAEAFSVDDLVITGGGMTEKRAPGIHRPGTGCLDHLGGQRDHRRQLPGGVQ
jgi:hypothetical protein